MKKEYDFSDAEQGKFFTEKVVKRAKMEMITLSKSELENIINSTVKKTLQEFFANKSEFLEEMEDYYFGKLMQESDKSDLVSREEVFEILKSKQK